MNIGPIRVDPSRYITCRWCTQTHTRRYLCDPVALILAKMEAAGAEGNMPTVDFPDNPIPLDAFGPVDGDAVMRQLVVQAATMDVAGVARAALVFTGRALDGRTLPRWTYVGTDDEVEGAAELVQSRAQLAVVTAKGMRDRVNGSGPPEKR